MVRDASTVYTNSKAVLDQSLTLSIKSHASEGVEDRVRAAGFNDTLNVRTLVLMTEAAVHFKMDSFVSRNGFIRAGIHSLSSLAVLEKTGMTTNMSFLRPTPA